ncbi:MAG: hypothetical protein ACLUJR_12305 [Mediterraneibacter gnavus]
MQTSCCQHCMNLIRRSEKGSQGRRRRDIARTLKTCTKPVLWLYTKRCRNCGFSTTEDF